MCTNVCIDADEFANFEIESESDISFCLKELKVCLLFGNWFDLALNIGFKKKGRPIIFGYKAETYEAQFIFSTLVESTASQSPLLSSSSTAPSSCPSAMRVMPSSSTAGRTSALDTTSRRRENENDIISKVSNTTPIAGVKTIAGNK